MEISREAGLQLRRARIESGLTLRALRILSAGKFKASAVGAYERGERSITLERFCELCSIYGVEPDKTLARALGTEDGLGGARAGDEIRLSGAETSETIILDGVSADAKSRTGVSTRRPNARPRRAYIFYE
jgi:transcriptional regulator with XRE-family HTH domain